MPITAAGCAAIAPNVLLDGRLALFHETEGWMAVADLHFGYELSQRVAGRLMPLWGMASVEDRLVELLVEYKPCRLIIVGDLVHDQASAAAAGELLARLRERCEVIALAGNHDRHVAKAIEFLPRWETLDYVFHHGDCGENESERIQIIGHHHPAASISDGAGLHLKFPAFIQLETVARASDPPVGSRKLEARATRRCWILPAFSPWAGGVVWEADDESRIWLCTPGRILRLQ